MTFNTAFEKIKDKIGEYDFNSKNNDYAIQVKLTNKDCEGTFYIQSKDSSLFVEPYDYYDNDVSVCVTAGDFTKLVDGKTSLDKVISANKIEISGDGEKIREFLYSLSKKED